MIRTYAHNAALCALRASILIILLASLSSVSYSAGAHAAGADAANTRVASINLCTDELLLELLPAQRIASLSWLVRDGHLTWYSDAAASLPVNDGSVEGILATSPDLVIAGEFSAPITVSTLERLGVPVVRVLLPRSIEQIEQQIIELGATLGVQSRAQKIVESMRNAMATSPPKPSSVPATAILYRPNGLTADAGSLAHDVMRSAGLNNLAATLDQGSYRRLDLESLLYLQPDLTIFDQHQRQASSLAVEMLKHPALRLARGKRVHIPAQDWTCGSPRIVDAVQRLRRAAAEL